MNRNHHINSTNGTTSQAVQRLEIEDEDERLSRMHNVFMQLDSKVASQAAFSQQHRSFDFGDRSTFVVDSPTDLLSRVQAFLPEIAASNVQLELQARENPQSIDIENVRDGEAYVQMKLGLGVFETGTAKAGNDADMHDTQTSSSSSGSRSGSNDSSSSDIDTEMSNGSDSDTDSDTSSIDIISAFTSAIPRPIRPLPRRNATRPGIVVLGGGSSPSSSQDASPSSASGLSQA